MSRVAGSKKTVLRAVLFLLMLVLFAPQKVRADAITYPVTYQQTSARSVADMVNNLRRQGSWYWNESNTQQIATGALPALTYDYQLEQAAMTRAAELALYYDHTRPDGSSSLSVLSEFSCSYSSYGENIAAGYTAAAEVFNGWLEENKNYVGQGHRRNMLKSSYTAIGMGHVICNGVHYWAMELKSPVSSPNTATAADNGSRNVTVQASSAYISGTVLQSSCYEQMHIGESQTVSAQFFVKGKNVNGWETKVPVSASITVSVDDSSLMSVSGMKLTARGAGTAHVTVSASSSYGSASKTYTVKIGRVDLAYADIYLAQKQYTWSGRSVCPKPVVTYHGVTLQEGIDYTLTYARNDKCTRNTGGANVAAIGIGNFEGMRAETFEILAADISTLNPRLAQTSFVYDGLLKEPEVIIDGYTYNKDYRVEYSNNRLTGTGRARVSGIGNCTGTVTLTFSITKGGSAAGTADSSEKAVTLKKPKITSAENRKGRKIQVKWTKRSGVDGYQVRYKTGKTTKTVKVKGAAAVKKVISRLKKGKTYTINVRSYKKVGGRTYYSAWSAKKKVKIRK